MHLGRAAVAAFVLVALVAAGAAAQQRGGALRLFRGGEAPVVVGAAPRGLAGVAAEDCAQCHAEIAREWRESLHAQAWRDPVFQTAYAIEPLAFCRNCHAPLTRPDAEPDAFAAQQGVSCAVCHVRDGHVLGAGEGRGDTARADTSAAGPHPVTALRAFRESGYCAGCHQFDFPDNRRTRDGHSGGAVFATDEPMQDTHEEWAASSAAARGAQCQQCHMPLRVSPAGRIYRSHAFPGGRDPAMLARAVTVAVDARREGGELVVRALVGPGDTGHAFPTGDLFRRGELRVWLEGREHEAQSEPFAREFGDMLERGAGGALRFVRREVADSRVPPPGFGPPRAIEFRFAAPTAPSSTRVRVRWALDHLLMPTPQAASQGFGEARNRRRVLEGDVAVPDASPARPGAESLPDRL